MTLRKDCKCPCHKAKHAVIHVVPCCGPGSEGYVARGKHKPEKAKHRKPAMGTLRGRIRIHDPDWWKPMTEEEFEDLFGRGDTSGRK